MTARPKAAVGVALEARAAPSAMSIIEARARDFAMRPAMLDLLEPYRVMLGLAPLSKLPPRQLRVRLEELIVLERATPRRDGGPGGGVLVTIKAAAIYAGKLIEIENKAKVGGQQCRPHKERGS